MNMSDHMRYNRVAMKRCNGFRGFRINPKRFSVQRLRSKFLYLLRIFNKLRSSYGNALQSLRRNISRSRSSSEKDYFSRRSLVMKEEPYTIYNSILHNYGRSNSFYSEAIADCLDFIKRNSLSVEDDQNDPVLNER